MLKIWGSFVAAVIFSLSAYAGTKPITCDNSGSCRFERCGVTPQAKFKLKGSSVGGTTSKKGCAKGSFKGTSGDHLTLIVDGENSGSFTVPKFGSSNGNRDKEAEKERERKKREKQKAEQERREREKRKAAKEKREREKRQAEKEQREYERERAKKEKALRKARNSGENAARFFANQYVKTYGYLENYRYFYARSYRMALLQRVGGSSYTNLHSYDRSYDIAQERGEAAGSIAGNQDAETKGSAAARKEVLNRFKAAAHNPDAEVNTEFPEDISVYYSGANSNKNAPGSLSKFSAQYNDSFHDSLKRRQFAVIDGFAIRWDLIQPGLWALDFWVDREYTGSNLSSWYGAEWAFTNWQDSYFGRSGSSEKRFYRNASWGQKQAFEREFKSQFREVINVKWQRAISNRHSEAAGYGRNDGANKAYSVAEFYAKAMGAYDGYTLAYSDASKFAFTQNISTYYTPAFNDAIEDLTNGVFIDVDAIQVSLKNGYAASPGESITIVLDNVINYGLAEGEMSVAINNNTEIVVPIDFTSGARQEAIIIDDALIISRTAKSGTYKISVKVNNQIIKTLSVKISWQSIVRSIARLDVESAMFRNLVGRLKNKVKDEWNNWVMDGGTFEGTRRREPSDIYKSDRTNSTPKTRLGQLVQTLRKYRELSSEGKQPLKKALKKAFGKRPSGWRSDDKRKWDSAMKLINSI